MVDCSIFLSGENLRSFKNRCPFIEQGVGVVGWEGDFSPCLSLLHSHVSYLHDRVRYSRRWLLGNIKQKTLIEQWNDPEHIAFHHRVKNFVFSPCTSCGGCELAEKNEEDCHGNKFPTCGGCLWGQGIIQCP